MASRLTEVIAHDVEMQEIGTPLFHVPDLFSQSGKVGRENRRRDLWRHDFPFGD